MGRAKLSRDDFDTVSKQKYYNMIDAWGGWPLFQELLSALSKIGMLPLKPRYLDSQLPETEAKHPSGDQQGPHEDT